MALLCRLIGHRHRRSSLTANDQWIASRYVCRCGDVEQTRAEGLPDTNLTPAGRVLRDEFLSGADRPRLGGDLMAAATV